MEDCKELRIEADTFEKLRRDTNIVLQKALGTMKDKGSAEGKVSIALEIKMVREFIPNFDPEIEGETREILKPKFEHKVTSAINIKNEEKGGVNPEMGADADDRNRYSGSDAGPAERSDPTKNRKSVKLSLIHIWYICFSGLRRGLRFLKWKSDPARSSVRPSEIGRAHV